MHLSKKEKKEKQVKPLGFDTPERGLTIIESIWKSGTLPYLVANTSGWNLSKLKEFDFSGGRSPLLTFPLRYWFIADSHKMYNLLTLVDRLHFICKSKRKSISVMKKKKKISTMVESDRVIYTGKSFSVAEKRDEVEPRRHWGVGLSVGGPLRWHDDEYLSFFNSFFKHYKTLEISIIYRKI